MVYILKLYLILINLKGRRNKNILANVYHIILYKKVICTTSRKEECLNMYHKNMLHTFRKK